MLPSRTFRIATTAVAAVLLLTACGDNDTDEDPTADGPPDTAEENGESDEPDMEDLLGEDGDLELPDPNDQVENNEFRGEGIILPVPDGYELDPGAFMQGLVAAVTQDGERQIAGQAVDTATLPDAPDLQEVIDANSEQFGEPALDESIEVAGATDARQLRYDTLPSNQPEQPELTLLLIVAEDGDGELAIFNYVAPTDEYDDEEAQMILSAAGFDPDSSPQPPEPAPAP